MPTCVACHAGVADGSRFCSACGRPLSSYDPVTRPDTAETMDSHGSGSGVLSDARFAAGVILAERYRLIALLGKGAMGEVYRADDLKLGQTVALKFLPASLSADPARLARFHNEVRLARQIAHKNVCRVYDIGEAAGLHFLSMEYVDGDDLSTLLRRIGRFPQERAVEIARQICAGLAAVHDTGVVHRDLKPANIMIDSDGQARIADFGLAAVDQELDDRVGTPAYMAPEQLAGKGATPRSDIYALGLVLFELFTGRRALNASTVGDLQRLHDSGSVTHPSAIVADLDPAIERAILRCLEKDPQRRPSTAIAVAAALPGGDPLAAAIAAGETPSPEMVAAAGEIGAVRALVGLTLVAWIVGGMATVAFLSDRTALLPKIPFDRPPAVLADRAHQILVDLGYAEPAVDRTGRFEIQWDVIRHLYRTSLPPERETTLSTGRPATVLFWYRESPAPLSPWNLSRQVTTQDPPLTQPGMRLVHIDPSGRLLALRVVAPRSATSTNVPVEPDWSQLFRAADLSMDTFRPADPAEIPPMFVDSRRAWVGTDPSDPNRSLRVEAGGFLGQVVFFRVTGPWTQPDQSPPRGPSLTRRAILVVGVVVGCGLAISAAILARRNLRLGRSDHRAAARTSVFVLVTTLGMWLLGMRHIADPLGVASVAALTAGVSWALYIAFEPYVRRFWPESLMGWTRLLAGRWRDSRVGRDLLFGLAGGVAVALWIRVLRLIILSVTASDLPTTGSLWPSLSTRFFASELMNVVLISIENAMLSVFAFVLMRILLRRASLAVVGGAFVFLAVALRDSEGEPLIEAVFIVGLFAIMAWVTLRHGLLASIAAFFVFQVCQRITITTHVSAWYAVPSVSVLFLITTLALVAFYLARAGEPLFGRRLLED